MYPCPSRLNCEGGDINANQTATQALCRIGSEGPLCSQCSRNYFLSEYEEGCLVCRVQNAWLGPLIVLIIVMVLTAIALRLRGRAQAFYERHKHKIEEYGHRSTVLFVTMQILLVRYDR